MKRVIIFLGIMAALVTGTSLHAQNMWDAYRYSQQFNEGTARSVAMGNASVALGGDMGNISINPAASGVFRYHEFVITPSFTTANSSVNYLGSATDEGKSRFSFSNFGYIATIETGRVDYGLVNWNLGVAFNKTNNYNSRTGAYGKTAESSWLSSLAQSTNGVFAPDMDMNEYRDPFYNGSGSWTSILGWNTSLLDTLPDSDSYYKAATENLDGYSIVPGGEVEQFYLKETVGNTSEAVLNFGGNFANKLFFGVNLGIVSIWYKHNEIYSERAVNPSQFQSGFSSFRHNYNYTTSGTGINLKAGIIYLPVEGLRLGASISTPTWMYLHEEYEEAMESQFTDGYSQYIISPLGTYDYRINTPFRWNVGAAYTIGSVAAISVDYESANYSRMKMIDDNYTMAFYEDNEAIKREFKSSDIIRAGAEVRVVPSFAVRAGYQYYSSGYKYDKANVQIGSIGVGYASEGGFFADLAYQQQIKKTEETFQLYDDIIDDDGAIITAAPVGQNRFGNWKLLLSVGIRF